MTNVIHHDFNKHGSELLYPIGPFVELCDYAILPPQIQIKCANKILMDNFNNADMIGYIPIIQFVEELHSGYISPATHLNIIGYNKLKTTNDSYFTQVCGAMPIPEMMVDGKKLPTEECRLYELVITTTGEYQALTESDIDTGSIVGTHPLINSSIIEHITDKLISIVKSSGGHVCAHVDGDAISLIGTITLSKKKILTISFDCKGKVKFK